MKSFLVWINLFSCFVQREDETRQKRPTTASQRTFINFVSAKQRKINQKASSKAKRRGQELLKIIDLDFVSFDMFDLPPVKEYELYMRSFGRSDTKQVGFIWLLCKSLFMWYLSTLAAYSLVHVCTRELSE